MKAKPQPHQDFVDPRRVLVVFAVYLYAFVWLIVGIATHFNWLNNLLRPYLANWTLLAIGLSTPITLAVVSLRSIPWKITRPFLFILPLQGALFGLIGEKYRYVQGAVTVFVFFEAYVILPEWNRRIIQSERNGGILGLDQPRTVGPEDKS
jgi:hypothetical protein